VYEQQEEEEQRSFGAAFWPNATNDGDSAAPRGEQQLTVIYDTPPLANGL